MSKRVQVSLYLDDTMIKKAKQICLNEDIKRVNTFYEMAIIQAILNKEVDENIKRKGVKNP